MTSFMNALQQALIRPLSTIWFSPSAITPMAGARDFLFGLPSHRSREVSWRIPSSKVRISASVSSIDLNGQKSSPPSSSVAKWLTRPVYGHTVYKWTGNSRSASRLGEHRGVLLSAAHGNPLSPQPSILPFASQQWKGTLFITPFNFS